jgi:murein DD-endopeptidase MepM/ murein hydrolase activator NlpD
MRTLVTAVLAFAAICLLAWMAADLPAAKARPVSAALRAVSSIDSTDSIAIPVVGVESSDLRDNFGDARVGHTHGAIDIMAPRGALVVAAVDGKVRKLFTSKAGGITLYEADSTDVMMYYYAHLDRYADGVREGQLLRKGDVIGYVGSTGNAPAHRPHLHFAIQRLPETKEWWRGEAVNPYPILMERGVTIRAGRFEVRGSN